MQPLQLFIEIWKLVNLPEKNPLFQQYILKDNYR